MHSKSNRYYVHVQLFEATMEQEKKFETLMPNFKYSRMINEGDVEYKLLPRAYVIQSTLNSNQILEQTFSVANSVGVNAHIFVCPYDESATLLPCADFGTY
ncbi:hypothetical protein FIA73_19775 [Escherichia coli]|nr:hypothetical protein [Escherichia coli]